MTNAPSTTAEEVLLEIYPSMWRNRPFLFGLVLLFCLVGVGLPILWIWWLDSRATTLTITSRRTILRSGLLSKRTDEVMHLHVRNIMVKQSLFQRIFGVGEIGISSSGEAGVEITASGVPDPEGIRVLIDRFR